MLPTVLPGLSAIHASEICSTCRAPGELQACFGSPEHSSGNCQPAAEVALLPPLAAPTPLSKSAARHFVVPARSICNIVCIHQSGQACATKRFLDTFHSRPMHFTGFVDFELPKACPLGGRLAATRGAPALAKVAAPLVSGHLRRDAVT